MNGGGGVGMFTQTVPIAVPSRSNIVIVASLIQARKLGLQPQQK